MVCVSVCVFWFEVNLLFCFEIWLVYIVYVLFRWFFGVLLWVFFFDVKLVLVEVGGRLRISEV